MPIVIKDYSWSQTADTVKICLKFKKPKTGAVDLFSSQFYIKLHCSPYFWEAFLWADIKDASSRCQIFDEAVQLTLIKCDSTAEWPTLEKELDVARKAQLRERAIKESHSETTKQQKEMVKYREEKKREEIMSATERDSRSREDYAKQLKQAARSEVLSPTKEFEKPKPLPSIKKLVNTPIPIAKPKPALPPLRKSGSISISFSDRNFVTPQRESQALEEREWLLKQKEARKAIGFVEEDLRPEEKNPQWLKEKADQFFENVILQALFIDQFLV